MIRNAWLDESGFGWNELKWRIVMPKVFSDCTSTRFSPFCSAKASVSGLTGIGTCWGHSCLEPQLGDCHWVNVGQPSLHIIPQGSHLIIKNENWAGPVIQWFSMTQLPAKKKRWPMDGRSWFHWFCLPFSWVLLPCAPLDVEKCLIRSLTFLDTSASLNTSRTMGTRTTTWCRQLCFSELRPGLQARGWLLSRSRSLSTS